MGGNARTVKNGEDVFAQKVDLTKFKRKFVKDEVLKMLQDMDNKLNIWPDFKQVKNGYNFNGSSDALMNDEIPDEEYTLLKPMLGDIDIMLPDDTKEKVHKFLDTYKGTSTLKFIGHNKPNKDAIGHQINAIFELQSKDAKGTVDTVNLQIDFEFVEFEDGKGSEFSKFAHSSSWEDMKQSKFVPGLKGGVAHKLLLRSLFGGASLYKDALVVTPKSTPEKIVIKKTKGVQSELRMLKFSVDRGLRKAYAKFTKGNKHLRQDGKLLYIEVPTKDSSYVKTVQTIAEMVFGELTKTEHKLFWSYTGLLKLMTKLDKKSKLDTYKRLLDVFWQARPGKNIAQGLERDNPELDLQIKVAAITLFHKVLKVKDEKKVKEMTDLYYSQYATSEVID